VLLQLRQLGVLVWIWLRLPTGDRRVPGTAPGTEPGTEELIRWSAAALVAFVALGKVLSPQFLIWLVPAVPLVAGLRGLRAATLLVGALVLTQLWFPSRYWDLARELDAFPSLLVLARDVVLVALLVVLLTDRDANSLDRRSPAGLVALDEYSFDLDASLGGLEAHRQAGPHPVDRLIALDPITESCGPVMPGVGDRRRCRRAGCARPRSARACGCRRPG
jgi:hypothetical protein